MSLCNVECCIVEGLGSQHLVCENRILLRFYLTAHQAFRSVDPDLTEVDHKEYLIHLGLQQLDLLHQPLQTQSFLGSLELIEKVGVPQLCYQIFNIDKLVLVDYVCIQKHDTVIVSRVVLLLNIVSDYGAVYETVEVGCEQHFLVLTHPISDIVNLKVTALRSEQLNRRHIRIEREYISRVLTYFSQQLWIVELWLISLIDVVCVQV